MVFRRKIEMSLLCQIEMTLPGGFAELAYEPSVLGQTKEAASWAGALGGGRALRYAGAPRPPDPDDGSGAAAGPTAMLAAHAPCVD